MAVTGAPPVLRPVPLRTFARLKLRIIGNGLRGRPGRIALFVVGAFWGALLAVAGFAILVASGHVGQRLGLVLSTGVGATMVLGWLLLPVLVFGVDETLDPARFALFPLRRRTLAAGMLSAACVGIPPLATLVAGLGLVLAGSARAGLAGALSGLLVAVLTLVLCVVLSRAVTSALAAMLRSRRVRDLTAVLLAVLAASIGPLNLIISSTAQHATLAPLLRLARILDWTPVAAGFAIPYDLAAGRPLVALARLGIMLLSIALLLWWWSHTLESAMVGASGGATAGGKVLRGGAVDALVPRLLRVLRSGPYAAITARELRYWSRDPRRRAGLISITIGGAVVPIALRLNSVKHGGNAFPLPIAVALSCLMGAAILSNQFGFDGSAYATHLLVGVNARTDLRARLTALLLILCPVLYAVAIVVGLLTGAGSDLIPTFGTMAGALGDSMAIASVISVVAAYPVQRGNNPLAMNTGTGGAKGLLSLAGMVGSLVVTVPLLLGAVLLPAGLRWLVLPIGVAWGYGAIMLGTVIAAGVLERRGPELLAAVTTGGPVRGRPVAPARAGVAG